MKCSHRVRLFILLAALVLLILGCTPVAKSSTPDSAESHKLNVITTLFPTYDFARTLLGDTGEVTLLLPPGIEAHAYEPTPQDIVRVSKADVFIYTGSAMEPWATEIIKAAGHKGLMIVDASSGIELMASAESETEAAGTEDAGHDHEGADPHIWLDPVLASQMADTIANSLIKAAPQRENAIAARLGILKSDLDKLDKSYLAAFEKLPDKKILYAGHFAFGYMAKRYGFDHISPYEGFAPNAEPTPARIAQLIDTLKASGSKYIFYQELIDPRVARIISDETGAQMLMLHGAHNVSKEDMAKGITYLQIMEQNLINLKKGLGIIE